MSQAPAPALTSAAQFAEVPARAAPAHEPAIDPERVWAALRTVVDPEVGLDIVSMGLVYGVELYENAVRVTFTLTMPGCPMEGVIAGGIASAVGAVPGVEHVLTHLVWEPAWNPGMIQEGAW